MFTKIYDKVINYIKEEYKLLIVLFLILFFGLFQIPYNIYLGGGLIDINDRIKIEDAYKETGTFNMTYVKSLKATIPTYLLSYVFGWERESISDMKLDENDNATNIWKRDQLYLKEANDSAIISAYTKAGEEVTINKELLEVLYIDKDSDTDLEIGDIILEIGGNKINSYDEMREIIKNYSFGEKVTVTLSRNEKVINGYFKVREIDGEKKAGLYLIKLYDYNLSKKIELDFSSKEGGPSGGFMLSLAIYNKLTKEDLTKGRKIAGTGTIDKNGNIGEIGGVNYKVMGAYAGDADILFVPEANYDEAMKVKNEKGYNLNIVKIKTLDEAIEYLRRN